MTLNMWSTTLEQRGATGFHSIVKALYIFLEPSTEKYWGGPCPLRYVLPVLTSDYSKTK